jgi:hypothetical protein
MSLLELLRKSGSDGDVDFLKEALNVLVHSLMEAHNKNAENRSVKMPS